MPYFTVFGARGFIGSHLRAALEDAGHSVLAPPRGADPDAIGDMGHVVYCAGVTADFRERPYDTMDAHVGYLSRVLRAGSFDSLLYLSSTRIYDGAADGAEDGVVNVDPMSPSDLYNLSKLAGESLCLNESGPTVRVARISNAYGTAMFANGSASTNFLASVIADAVSTRPLVLGTSPASAKDYVHIFDVVRALVLIALAGSERIYNVASGENVTHEDLLDRICALTGREWSSASDAPVSSYPRIRTERLAQEFAQFDLPWRPARLFDRLDSLIRTARGHTTFREGAAA